MDAREPEEALSADLRHSLDKLLNALTGVEVLDADVRHVGEGLDALLDISYSKRGPGVQHGRDVVHIKQTIAVFYRPGVDLPAFNVSVRDEGFLQATGEMLLAASGAKPVELPGRDALEARYRVNSFNPGSVRALLEGAPLDALEKAGDLDLRCEWDVVIASRGITESARFETGIVIGAKSGSDSAAHLGGGKRVRDLLLSEPEREALMGEAGAVVHAFVDDPEALRRAADAVPGSYTHEARQHLETGGRLIGALHGDRLFSEEMAEALLDQTPPRKAPRSVVRRAVGRSGWTAVPGAILLAIAGVALYLRHGSWIGGGDDLLYGDAPWIAGAVLGVLLLGRGVRRRTRRKRVLERGRVVPATVVSVDEAKGLSVDGDRTHEVVFETQDPATPRASVTTGMFGGRLARRLLAQNDRTRILLDPRGTGEAIWPHAWLTGN